MRLVLIRHAKAEPHLIGQSDQDRALVAAGRTRAAANAQLLAEAGVRLDLALVSPSVRTRQTWDVIGPILGGQMQIAPSLYHASPETVMACVEAAAGPDETLAVIGHNPGMAELAYGLAIAARAPDDAAQALAAGFPTASAAVFDWAEDSRAPGLTALAIRERLIGV